MKKQQEGGFTLIELLVVIAVIAILMSILMPALRRAKEQARRSACLSNMRQLGIAISTYESTFNFDFRTSKRWWYGGGTADVAFEWQPQVAKDIMDSHILPDREVFFCPSVRNLSCDRNYFKKGMVQGDLNAYPTKHIEESPRGDKPAFWSTHAWIWKKMIREGQAVTSVNDESSGAMLVDMSPGAWTRLTEWKCGLGEAVKRLNIMQAVEHYNVLMKDMSAINPANSNVEINRWLWGTDTWAGTSDADYYDIIY